MVESVFLSDIDFGQYRSLIYNESGITFTPTNRSILESRLKERLREVGVNTPQQYYSMLIKDGDELKKFLDSITTNLTRFFRNQAQFDALEKFAIPELMKLKKPGDNTIRIWSAGCSSGEEPYSIAMLMTETLPYSWKFEIIASDISLSSLMVGKKGFYSDTRSVGIPDPYLKKYFQYIEGEGYQAKPEIMSKIRFDYHNLKHDSGQRNVDIVFCRNVIIYFDEVAQAAVMNRFWDVMSSKSFLFIGHSESLFGMDTKFEFVKTAWATLYRKFI